MSPAGLSAQSVPPEASAPYTPSVGSHRRKRRSLESSSAPFWLLTPAGLVLLAFTVLPIGVLVYASFTDYGRRALFTGVYRDVGLEQYRTLLADSEFWQALIRTVLFTAALLVGSMGIGVALAQLLTRLGGGMRQLVSIVLILVWAMPTVASSLVWRWMFQPSYGVMNWILTKLRLFGDMTTTDWSNHTWLALTSIWLLIVWQAVPFIALTFYAALIQIPVEAQEAARLDGARDSRVWWSISLPFVRPTLGLLGVMSIIWDFNIFNQIWLVSSGGPGDGTTTLGIFSYRTAFVGFKIGQGAAQSVITVLLLLTLTAMYIRNLLGAGEDL